MSMLVFADDNTSLSGINYSVKLVMILKTDVDLSVIPKNQGVLGS